MRSPILAATVAALLLTAAPPALSQSPAPPSAAALFPSPERDRAALKARIEARIARLVSENGFAGVVRVDLDGKPLVRMGVGYADPVSKRPFRPDTQIEMASIGKTFTAAAILKLRDQGKLKLDDPLSRFFPDAPADKAGITIFQLLTGSSGLGTSRPQFSALDRAGFEARVMRTPLAAKPGERFIYSNTGFNLLGAIVERVSGRSYEAFLRDEILKPAGARHTGYRSVWQATTAATDANGRSIADAAWGGKDADWNIIGAGGMVTTADDMLAFEHAFMAGRIVSPASVKEGTTGWVDHGAGGPPGKYSFGRGVMVDPVFGKVVWHNGGDPTFTSYFADLSDHHIVFFLSSNSHADATASGIRLQRAMFGQADPAPQAR